MHYKEYLVGLINRNAIDPAELMSIDELVIVLNRSEVATPERQDGENEDIYRERILNVSWWLICRLNDVSPDDRRR